MALNLLIVGAVQKTNTTDDQNDQQNSFNQAYAQNRFGAKFH